MSLCLAQVAETVQELHEYQSKRELAHLDNLSALSTDHSLKTKTLNQKAQMRLQHVALAGVNGALRRWAKGRVLTVVRSWQRAVIEQRVWKQDVAREGLVKELTALQEVHETLRIHAQREAESLRVSMLKDSQELARLQGLLDHAIAERGLSQTPKARCNRSLP